MTMTADQTGRTAPSSLPDQPEHWFAYDRPEPFEVAVQRVLDAHRDDRERPDVVAHELRTSAFEDRHTMAIWT